MKDYPQRYRELSAQMEGLGRDLPGPMRAFESLHESATVEGALDAKTKELIALGIAITVRCDGCIAYHVHDALKAGAHRREIVETIGVAVMMGGGPSVVYGAEAHAALEQFERVPAEV
ncbi:MAG: carboxymuconolactone decarboxylase family protein [Elusimicrobia bacterium]|nr:carboxymuconolactone decarboxylase family protein [Elusimicrobiota bacterium]